MNATLDRATIRLNVWRWRRENTKRAIKIEVRQHHQPPELSASAPVNAGALELAAIKREASGFRNGLEGICVPH